MKQTSWNKGKKNIYSEATLKKMSETRKKLFKEGKLVSPNKKNGVSLEVRKKISNTLKEKEYIKEENNPNWKGDKVGYVSLHSWVKRRKLKPLFCEKCNKNKPYDLANISGEYKRDINDFEWLCRKCHMEEDGRLAEFIIKRDKINKKRKQKRNEKISNNTKNKGT